MPQISVVIPIFNTERYLEACLLSIMDQNFSDFEVICVDDLSTDRSREIVEDILEHIPATLVQYRVYTTERAGQIVLAQACERALARDTVGTSAQKECT